MTQPLREAPLPPHLDFDAIGGDTSIQISIETCPHTIQSRLQQLHACAFQAHWNAHHHDGIQSNKPEHILFIWYHTVQSLSSGTQDFSGPRYHCQDCPDYDLCQECNAKREPVPRHRYLFEEGRWTREGGFHDHADDHKLEEIFTVPADGCEWRRRQQGYLVDRF